MTVQRSHAAGIRHTAAQILAAAGTLAGSNVEEERVDAIADGDTPRLVLFADVSGQNKSHGGSAVTLEMSLNLVIQALVQHAAQQDAVDALDTLTTQAVNALLEDPAFTTLIGSVASLRVVNAFKTDGAYITGDARIQITAGWQETYNPRLTTYLAGLDVTTAIGIGDPIVSTFITSSDTGS